MHRCCHPQTRKAHLLGAATAGLPAHVCGHLPRQKSLCSAAVGLSFVCGDSLVDVTAWDGCEQPQQRLHLLVRCV